MLEHKAKILIGANKNKTSVRVDQIIHDIAVIDTAIYLMKRDGLKLGEVISDKEMQSKDGFATRRHYPDFVFEERGDSYCVEVELSLKDKEKLAKNIKANFIDYDFQIWIVPKNDTHIRKGLKSAMDAHPNIAEVIDIESVREYVKQID